MKNEQAKTGSTRKANIYEAAVQLFRDKGYPAATMRDLADRVGLKQASSLYNHVSSKEEILQNICFDINQFSLLKRRYTN